MLSHDANVQDQQQKNVYIITISKLCAVTPQEVGRYTSHHKAWKSGDFRVAKRLADVSIPDV